MGVGDEVYVLPRLIVHADVRRRGARPSRCGGVPVPVGAAFQELDTRGLGIRASSSMNRTIAVTLTSCMRAARLPILSLAAPRWMPRRIRFKAEARERPAPSAEATGVSGRFKSGVAGSERELNRPVKRRWGSSTHARLFTAVHCRLSRAFFLANSPRTPFDVSTECHRVSRQAVFKGLFVA